ncbi:hypothetical protein OSB04_000715 [Centaurea solstitialis]|uniref:Reverse transcriptase domain-containing protein n=1 Tax=Centaurea solstitialis TaxID=347529 RepID=A0AA38TPV3_9ASTR|nr:hypothetical protein OSB04_000715 [Centaurea solstitialis]
MKSLFSGDRCKAARGRNQTNGPSLKVGDVTGDSFVVDKEGEGISNEDNDIQSSNQRNWRIALEDSIYHSNSELHETSKSGPESFDEFGALLGFRRTELDGNVEKVLSKENVVGSRDVGPKEVTFKQGWMSYDIEQPAITEFRLQITSMLFLSSAKSSTLLMVGTSPGRMPMVPRPTNSTGFFFLGVFFNVWPNISSMALSRVYSDHCPILLDNGGPDFGPIPFKCRERAQGRIKDISDLKDKLSSIDEFAERNGLSDVARCERGATFEKIKELETLEHEDLRQKSKVRWVLEGDENSRFFHGIIKGRKRQNHMHGLLANGIWETDPARIKKCVHDFFAEKFSDLRSGKATFRSSILRKISKDHNLMLQAHFSDDEIKKAVWSVESDKTPGPDGYSFGFLKHFWEIIGPDFSAAVKCFKRMATLKFGGNESFISLLPKTKDPLRLHEYRPIHLMGCLSKTISKVLAERLKIVMDSIISPEQTAFVSGKNITDGSLMVNEIIAWAKRVHKSIFLFKIEKGVRQGDRLSPYLFIIAIEGLIAAIKEAAHKRLFKGITHPNNEPTISSLHYADDAIFLGVWNEGNIKNLMKILRWFHLASGLKINWSKSTLMGVKVLSPDLSCVAADHGVREGKIPFNYLGFPIGASMSKMTSWNPLIEKFCCKILTWKSHSLSFGGKITLCKSVLGSLGVFLFSLYKAPTGVLRKLESLRMNFFWGSDETKKKIKWVAWDKVINGREKGGLGIGSLKALNVALLSKWWWRFRTEYGLLWRKVIEALYGNNGALGKDSSTHGSSGVWGKIAAFYQDTERVNIPLDSLFAKVIGNGRKTKFWTDLWCSNKPFQGIFPRLAALDADRGCFVVERWIWGLSNNGIYTVASLRNAFDDMALRRCGPPTTWNKIVPGKVRVLNWRIGIDRLPTKVNLEKRGVLLDDTSCPVCKGDPETREHVFINCNKTQEVRRMIRG